MRAGHREMKKAALGLIALALAVRLLGGSPAGAQSDAALSPQEQRGKKIYLKGEGDGGEIKAVLGSSDLELSASAFPCANCHGLRGEGSSEGGLQPPPLVWSRLTAAAQSALTRATRGPYDENSLARAITSGVNANGAKLHPGMPNYKLSGGQMGDLIAYLKKLGHEVDRDPGITEMSIKVGSALPLSGPLARIGEDVKQALEAYFAEVNRQGGVYGRRFELVVADSHGDAPGTLGAARRLVDEENVFALVGSFEPAASESTNELLKQREVPLVGPVTLSPRQPAVPNPYVFYLLPSFADQSRSLVDFVSAGPARAGGRPASRLAVIYAESELDRDALAGLKSQARLHSMEVVVEQAYQTGRLAAASAVRSLAEKPVDAVFFFGGGDEFAQFAAEMDRANLDARLLSSAIMTGRSVFGLSPAMAARTFLAYPASLPDRDDFGEFISVMQKSGVPLRSAAFQAVAFAAAKIFVEAVKASTRQVNRADLIRALEQLHDYATGVIAPVSFGPNRRTGANGSYVVRVDAGKKQYVPASDRIVPQARDQ
jgi:ABC-type branched-subunit amino acid transport system substrate-binding protein